MLRKFNPLIKLTLLAMIVLGLSLTACQKADDGSGPGADQGTVTVKITDDPFPLKWFAEVDVTITKIELHAVDSTRHGSFITIWEGKQSINLLELRNGVTSDFPQAVVPAGRYNMILLKIDSLHVKYVNGTEFSLNVPDNRKTGVRIIIAPPVEVQEGDSVSVLLDFDLSKSLVIRGGWHGNFPMPGFFRFRPVIRAMSMHKAGSIMGFVSDTSGVAIPDAQITVKADTVVSNAFTNHRGYYKVMALPQGTYSVEVQKEGYKWQEKENVKVMTRQATIANFELIPE
jgi:hypothetical protein